jgi:hypothetical protein
MEQAISFHLRWPEQQDSRPGHPIPCACAENCLTVTVNGVNVRGWKLPPLISSQAADQLFTWFNVALILGAVLALIGTFGTFWTGGIRDRYADERLRLADVKVAEANASAAAANERAAQSEKDAELAKLQTEKLKEQLSWRELSRFQESEVIARLMGLQFPIEISWVASDPEAEFFAESIRRALAKTQLKVLSSSPSLFLGVQPPRGISIAGRLDAVTALTGAFSEVGVALTRWPDTASEVTSITVGSRPAPSLQ